MTKLVSFYKKYHLLEDDSMSHEDEREDTPTSMKDVFKRYGQAVKNARDKKQQNLNSLSNEDKDLVRTVMHDKLRKMHSELGEFDKYHPRIAKVREHLHSIMSDIDPEKHE